MSGLAIWKRSGGPLRFQIALEADGAVQCSPVRCVPADLLWSEADRDDSIQVLIDGDSATLHRASPTLPLDLQSDVVVLHRVVAVHRPLGLNREDPVKVRASARNKS